MNINCAEKNNYRSFEIWMSIYDSTLSERLFMGEE